MQNQMFTGLFDDSGSAIYVGDILSSGDGFSVTVCQREDDNSFYGSLNCEIGHSCRDIPYALNGGQGYVKVYGVVTHEDDAE